MRSCYLCNFFSLHHKLRLRLNMLISMSDERVSIIERSSTSWTFKTHQKWPEIIFSWGLIHSMEYKISDGSPAVAPDYIDQHFWWILTQLNSVSRISFFFVRKIISYGDWDWLASVVGGKKHLWAIRANSDWHLELTYFE